jgi:ABC-type sulfate transport system permease component
MVRRQEAPYLLLSIVPVVTIFAAFFLLPFARLLVASLEGPLGSGAYGAVLTNPRYFSSLVSTILLALIVTFVTLVISGIAGVFLDRNHFTGRSMVIAALTLPLAFPGVVVGFMVIMLGGRQGVIGEISKLVSGQNLVFAYSIVGLFVGYVYFSIPRVILTVMAAAKSSTAISRRPPARWEPRPGAWSPTSSSRGSCRRSCRPAPSASRRRWEPSGPPSRWPRTLTCCR